MRRLVRPKPIIFTLALIALISAGVVAQHFRLFDRLGIAKAHQGNAPQDLAVQ